MTITFKDAWLKNDPVLEEDAIGFWTELNLIPHEAMKARSRELALVAYENGRVIGVSTLILRNMPMLEQKFAFLREAIRPEYRQHEFSIDLGVATRDLIEKYALEHRDERIAGMAAVFQAPNIGQRPLSRRMGFVLAGYTEQDEQVRVSWFEHYRLPPNLS